MKTAIIFILSAACVLLHADPPEMQIRNLIFNTLENRAQCKDLVAPDSNTIIAGLLDSSPALPGNWNLTEELFLFDLSQFLAPVKNTLAYTVLIEALESNVSVVIHKRKEQIKTSRIDHPPLSESSVKRFLVTISFGKDYPNEKILLLSMRKYKKTYVIEANACVFGSDSFFHSSGITYDDESGKFHWEQRRKNLFLKYLENKNKTQ